MSYIPNIIIKFNPEEDIKIFLSFLNHPFYVQNKNYIFAAFPELRQYTKNKNIKRPLSKFVKDFYRCNGTKIKKIIQKNELILKRNQIESFKLLSKLMDYQWKENTKYYGYISILPFSTFHNNSFHYSILGELNNRNFENKSLLSVGIHEISHMLFLELVRNIKEGLGFNLNDDTEYFVKEAFTTALMNNRDMRKVLGTKRSPGNPEIREFYVKNKNGKTLKLTDYFDKQLKSYRKRKLSFNAFLESIIKLTHQNETHFSEKMKIWKVYGKKIFDNNKLLDKYKKPIRLN